MAKSPVPAYDEHSIKVLKGLEPVQQRPGMYTRTEHPNHIIQEVVDNAQDEALAGFAKNITVTAHEDGSVSVQDDGRGIPTAIHPDEGVSTVEVVFTRLHAGGKFDKGKGSAYSFTGGLHGVGVSVTNALSSRLEVTVWRDGYEHRLVFAHGAVVEPLVRKKLPADEKDRIGTRVHAWPEPKYFDSPAIQMTDMERLLRAKAVLMPGTRLVFERHGKAPLEWHYPGGITQYLEEGAGVDSPWLTPIFQTSLAYQNEEPEDNQGFAKGEGFDLAMGWLEEGRAFRESFVNLIPTTAGGTHESGLRSGLLEAVRKFAERMNLIPKGVKLEAEDVAGRTSFVLSTKILDPQFQGQTKDRLNSKDAIRLVSGMLRDSLDLWLNDHLEDAKKIVEMAVQEAVRRSKASAKTERRKGSSATVLPGKLSDCEDKDVDRTELFLVEGDSAGGCFYANSMIALTNGKSISFADIVREQAAGQRHFGYTNDHGVVRVTELLHARMTKKNARLVEVRLDNGEFERCTPDHLFMLRDGTYRRADELTSGTALMPLYRRLSEKSDRRSIVGYEMVMNPLDGQWVFTHYLADDFNAKVAHNMGTTLARPVGRMVRHRDDFNKLNNDPTNIVRMEWHEHTRLHAELFEKTLLRPDVQARSIATKKTPAFRKKQSARMQESDTRAILSEQAIAQWEDPVYKQFMMDAWKTFYDTHPEYRELNAQQLDLAQRTYWASDDHRNAQAQRITEFYAAHPEAAEQRRLDAREQWQNPVLLAWRARTTAAQWTDAFRAQRKEKMDQHYYHRTMTVMKNVMVEHGDLCPVRYDEARKQAKDRYVMKLPTFTQRFFEGRPEVLTEAVAHHNHRVVSVTPLDHCEDVYDLEVPGTHNYALASGIFVHNSAKMGRDRKTQAILPLRGKVLNTWETEQERLFLNNEVHDIAVAIGVDPHTGQPVASVDMSRLRYGRICIMADADVDGQHIQVLLLTLFYKHFPAMVETGRVWIAQSPLFRVDAPPKRKGGGGKDRRKFYALDEKELGEIERDLTKEGLSPANWTVSRFKGLGEMNAEQLWDTTMNPDTRRMLKVTLDDIASLEAVAGFDMMMGGKNARLRREWMEKDGATVEADT